MSAAVPPATPPRLPTLDAIRAIGAVAVVGTHVGFATGAVFHGIWGGFLARLDVGVAIFFVLSGFLLFRPYAHAVAAGGRRPGTGRYLWRRALRILPAYWIVVIAGLTLVPENRMATTQEWFRFLTLTQIYQRDWLRIGLVQTWSLATEAVFYLLLPLIAILALGRRWRPRRAVIILVSGSLVVTGVWLAGMASGALNVTVHTNWFPSYAVWFGAGMVLATVHVALRTGTALPSWRNLDVLGRVPMTCWLIAAGLYAIATTPVTGPRDLSAFAPAAFGAKLTLYLGVAIMVLIPAAFNPRPGVRLVMAGSSGRWLGAVSYGLFLWHPMMIEAIYFVLNRPTFTGDTGTIFLLTLGCGLGIASISYYLVELPVQRWGARWPRRVPDHGKQPDRSHREDARELRAGGVMTVIAGQREPTGEQQQNQREPRLQRA